MMTTRLAEAHLSDGDLVRLVDAEGTARERARAEAHRDRCAECRRRLRRVERRSARWTELLEESDLRIPDVRADGRGVPVQGHARDGASGGTTAGRASRVTSWRRAAAIAILLGAGLAASPARAWITGWVAERWDDIRTAWTDSPPAASAGAEGAEQTRVRFAVQGTELAVTFRSRQSAGTLALEYREEDGATGEVELSADGSADLLVLPGGVRIRNDPASRADYRITLPTHVRRVRLRIGDGVEATFAADEIAQGRPMQLAPAER